MEHELEIDTSNMCIDRAHRIGSVKHNNRSQGLHGFDPKRPIIVKFRDYIDTETVMSKAYKLRSTRFGVDRDYPREIAEARKHLYKSEEATRARFQKVKVQIRYPARIFIDGNLK